MKEGQTIKKDKKTKHGGQINTLHRKLKMEQHKPH